MKKSSARLLGCWQPLALALLALALPASAQFRPTSTPQLPDFDRRAPVAPAAERAAEKQTARARLQAQLPSAAVDFDALLDSPKFVHAREGFLTGPAGQGRAVSAQALAAVSAADPYRPIKAFLNEHSALFGHDASLLDQARVKRDYTDAHNGLHTVAWEQQVNGIPVFQAVLVGHITKRGELTSIASRFVPQPTTSAHAARLAQSTTPAVSAAQAVLLAAQNIGETLSANDVVPAGGPIGDGNYLVFKAPQDAYVRQVWLPFSRSDLRLAWEVLVTKSATRERFQLLVDAQTGEAQLRQNLTCHISDASYNVWTSDSPSPFSPSLPVPGNFQPPLTNRFVITTPALDPIASPEGWIPDGSETTTGNNADAFLDRNLDGQPDQPRPQGTNRVFDFVQDMTQDPTNYIDASTVQLFYQCNWYHDRLYQLGFTEAAGNFQQNNFGRGGLANDRIICYVQAGADVGFTDNSMFQPSPDGVPGQCYMFIFTGPNPQRDGSLDAEVVFHEMTHGTSWRLVGGGWALGSLQGDGMGEGWGDFMALCLLGQPGDDPDANYALGGYAFYNLIPGFAQNYYFGVRRFPYTTDLTKNPFTFKDIDPNQVSPHTGVPRNPLFPFDPNDSSEVHHQGEVWCTTLWEVHAVLVKKYGWAVGNQLSMQLIIDGMKLTPALPNMLQARDAILLADKINNGGANAPEIWQAFAKRGFGFSASSPDGSTTDGVHEAFDVPSLIGLDVAQVSIAGGNGNGLVDPNECNDFYVVLTNTGSLGATNILVTATTTNEWVYFPQPTISYPDLQPGQFAANSTPFKLSTAPEFICGTPIYVNLNIKTDAGSGTLLLQLPSGTPGALSRYDATGPVPIPDPDQNNNPGVAISPLLVTNLTGAIEKVTVSLFTTHTWDSDLTFDLIGPDGTTVTLSRNNGASGDNYGLACAPDSLRTTFDDGATNLISMGRAPFLGAFKPEQPLYAFIGKAGTNANGLWQLRATDSVRGDTGILQCWSLNITSFACTDGGGQCPGTDLAIGLSASPTPGLTDSNLVYTITVTNQGPPLAQNVAVTHSLPPTVQFVSAVSSQGSCSFSSGMLSASLGDLPRKAVATVTVTVIPKAEGTIFSTATVASTEPELNPLNNSVTLATPVSKPFADLAVTLTDTPDPTVVGGALTYTVTVVNNGPSAATGVIITNTLPTSVNVNTVNPTQGTATLNGRTVLCNVGLLQPGQTAAATISVTPLQAGVFTALARVGALQRDPVLANNTAVTSTTIGQAADLAVGLTAAPNPVVWGSNLTYIVTVTNLGPNDATNVVASQLLPADVTVVSVGASQGSNSVTANTLVCDLGPLPVGATATITSVVNTASVTLGANNSVVVNSTAAVTSPVTDPNQANNTASLAVQVAPPFVNIVPAGASLTYESLSPPNGALDNGETVKVVLRLQNIGNVPNANLVATLLATNGITPAGTNASQPFGILLPVGTPGGVPVGREFTFSASGTPGATVSAVLQLRDRTNDLPAAAFSFILPTVATFTNGNAITIPLLGQASPYPSVITVSGLSNQVGKVTATLNGLTHSFVQDVNVLLVSPTGTKTLLMSHVAPKTAANDLTLTFDGQAASPMPGTDFVSIFSGSWQPTAYPPAVTFSNPAPAGPYSTLLSDLNGVNPNGDWQLFILDDNDGDGGFVSRGWSLSLASVSPVNQIADLGLSVLTSADPLLLGGDLTYTFVVSNAGPATATGVTFTNALPESVSLVSAPTSSQGNCVLNGNTIVGNLASLPAGAIATITVVTHPTAAGLLANSATVTAFESDLHTANNRVTATTAVTVPAADLALGLAAPASAIVGSNLTYTLAFTNNGPANSLAVAATDYLPAGVSFVSASAGCTLNNNAVTFTNLGTLTPGATASVTLTVTPRAAGVLSNLVVASTLSADTNTLNNSAAVLVSAANPAPVLAAAGAALTAENLIPDGCVNPGETVTVALSLVNLGQVDTANLTATLLASGGIASVSGGPVTYGKLAVGAAPVSRSFTFTAAANASGVVTASLQLQDGATPLGTVSFSFVVPGSTAFSNPNPITINAQGPAAPYPSTIFVSGLTGYVSKVSVTLSNLAHTFPSDVNALLVSPAGASVLLMSHAGSSYSLGNTTLTFDDAATNSLPSAAAILAGTYKPTQFGTAPAFPAPASKAPFGTTLANLNGVDPAGTWALYIFDDSPADGGAVANGWSLNLTTIQPVNPLADLALSMAAAPASTFVGNLVTYTITVANLGPNAVPGVVLTDVLPAGLVMVTNTTTQGSAIDANGNFNLGTLANGATATVTLTAAASFGGSYYNLASVAGTCTDLRPANNSAQAATMVRIPAPASLAASFINGQFQLLLTAEPGLAYRIQASADLSSWTDLSVVVPLPDGTIHFTDPAAPTLNARYYRAVRVMP